MLSIGQEAAAVGASSVWEKTGAGGSRFWGVIGATTRFWRKGGCSGIEKASDQALMGIMEGAFWRGAALAGCGGWAGERQRAGD